MVKGQIRNRVRELRAETGMTQADLARAVAVTRQTISALEADRYSPSLDLAFRIAAAFRRDIDVVFSYEIAGAQ